MSTLIEPGLPVEIGRIDKQLGQLWEESGDTKTRASLINLAIYTENPDSVASNTELIAQIAGEHACRALLIFADPAAETSGAKAWISAHCHLVGKGERQICSEQITFELDGEMVGALPNIVFSHLDSDLPLYLWWQGEFREPFDERLWTWIDRLIFDSAEWKDPATQFALAKKIDALTADRTVLCDLNWTRILGARVALAQLFDHSCALHRLKSIEEIVISSANRTTGLLVLGWLAAQFGWKFQSLLDREFFLSPEGNQIAFKVEAGASTDIDRCFFKCADASFELVRDANAAYYHVHITGGGFQETDNLVPAGRSKPADILLAELSRGGRHPLYAKALAAIEPLL